MCYQGTPVSCCISISISVGSGDDEFEDALNKDMESNYTLMFHGNHADERDTEGGGRKGGVSSSATKEIWCWVSHYWYPAIFQRQTKSLC